MHPIQSLLSGEYDARPYSGRGMGGAECLGYSISYAGLCGLLGYLIENVEDADREAVGWAIRSMRQDSLGTDLVVYFPGVEYEGPHDESESL